MKLNPAQAAVAACRDRRVLVLAGAGSGKTATSVHWVAGLVKSGVPRSKILMITFTRKAAQEMAARVERLISSVPKRDNSDKLSVGTYHAIAAMLMREMPTEFGLPDRNFTTLDESECHSVWKSGLKQLGIGQGAKNFSPAKLHSLYSLSRNKQEPIGDVLDPIFGVETATALMAVERYKNLKRAANAVDYDDLLGLWRDSLQENPALVSRLRARWSHVLVDEMQDNNRLNAAILEHLDPEHLMVVGDMNQSIYGFRGSEAQLVAEFPAKHRGTTVMRLEENYRSLQSILDLANSVVVGCEHALQLKSARQGEGRIRYHVYDSSTQEAAGVTGWMRDKIAAGTKPAQIAVLARSSKLMTALEIALNRNRIRYKKYGGLTLADAAEIKDFLSFLRASLNSRDRIAMLRALTQYPGVGEGTAERILSREREKGLFGDMAPSGPAEEMDSVLRELRSLRTLGEKGRFLFEKIKPLLDHNYPKDSGERMATVDTLVRSMENSDERLEDFLDEFSLSRATGTYHPEDCIVLSTVHSAKGLEWDSVWLYGAGSLQIPHPRAQDDLGELAEERRLLYVAVTRAKNELVLSYSTTTDRLQNQGPCPFLPQTADWLFGGIEINSSGPVDMTALFKQLTQAL